MPLFPCFIDLTDKNVLVVGAGKVALRKINGLLKFSPKITVVADRLHDEIKDLAQKNKLEVLERPFETGDIENQELVIVAADNTDLQKEIFNSCLAKKILCNSIDGTENSSFLFPAIVNRGDLSIGISTNGKSPYFAKKIRETLDKILPMELGSELENTNKKRADFLNKEITLGKLKEFVDSIFRKLGL